MTTPAVSGPSAAGPARLERLRETVGGLSAGDRILLTDGADIRWLCGFTGSNAWVVVGPDDIQVLTDGRYTQQAREEARSLGIDLEPVVLEAGQKMADLVARVVSTGNPTQRLFFQPRVLTVSDFRELNAAVGASLAESPDLSFLRRTKDPWEIEAISRAAEIADRALSMTLPLLSQRPTERDVRDELDHLMRRLGADGPSYDTIVAAGPVNSAMPHHRPDATIIEEGHTVVIDVGALVDGYHSDMTRTFLIGDVGQEVRWIYDAVREAQMRAVAAVGPGVPCSEVDRACRGYFEELGVADSFVHGTGHGVGLAIHEEPFVGRSPERTLEAGDVVTVEPGLYRMGLGGVRIEDLLVVTDEAHRCLTSLPKDDPCLPSPPTI